MTLDRLPLEREASVSEVGGGGPMAQRLLAMGFLPGASLKVVQVAPFGDPITVELNGAWRVSLRRADAAAVALTFGLAAPLAADARPRP